MAEILYREGDATLPQRDEPAVMAHVCNDLGAWGRGFVLALSRRWPGPELAYRALRSPKLGLVQIIRVSSAPAGRDVVVANMIAQHGLRSHANPVPLRYDTLRSCLAQVRAVAELNGAGVHMPRIGAGLAGGDWAVIEQIIIEELVDHDVDVTVYDLPRAV